MIESSAAYKTAIVADARRMLLRAVVDIIDPDISYGLLESNSKAWPSIDAQVHDKQFPIDRYATIEQDRWLLDSTFEMIPAAPAVVPGQIGFLSEAISGENGEFSPAVWIEMQFQNVSILQACSIWFSDDTEADGWPADFVVEIKQGGVTYHTQRFTDNTEDHVNLFGFTVMNPDAIRVTITRWAQPWRRVRIPEIVPGLYEEWDGGMVAEYTLKHQADVSCMSLPYGTCTLRMDNVDRRFEPRNKDGLFRSLEERQGIDISLGCRLPDGTDEYKRVGIMYQYSGGWKTGDNGLTMQWNLVDIIGLLQNREFIPPAVLPTDLEGWIAAIVLQLGESFRTRYSVDPNYSSKPLTLRDPADISGMKCGDLLRYACMATGTWPRADAETGKLAAEPLWSQGNQITLANMVNYPTIKANDDVAAILFTLYDEENTKYAVSGTSTASSETKSVNNPFIHTAEQALEAARNILAAYGGNRYEIVGRGDPASEIGDVDTIWLNESSATTARRIQQDLSLSNGVLKNCASILLQADGSFLFEKREIITQDGPWTAPAGVSQLRVILVGGGSCGQPGTDGTWQEAGVDGADGLGGRVWAQTIAINPQQTFEVHIGKGGELAQAGTPTTFGQYTSAQGQIFEYGYTDIQSGDSFARPGVEKPLPNSGDGGAGGPGGAKGNVHEEDGKTVIDSFPQAGWVGVDGQSGCVVVYWDIPDTASMAKKV